MTTRDVAAKLARRVFELRGNHSEAHLFEAELTAVLETACELTLKLRPDPMAVAELKRGPRTNCTRESFCVLQVGHAALQKMAKKLHREE